MNNKKDNFQENPSNRYIRTEEEIRVTSDTRPSWLKWKCVFKKYNIKYIPDVDKYELELGDWDKDFEKIGVKLRAWKRAKITRYGNWKMNKYMVHMLKRLWFKRFETKRVGIIKNILKSKVFFIAALNHVERYWYCESKRWIDRAWKNHKKKSDVFNDRKVKLNRIYIPKDEKRWRPLGVPTISERTSLHLLNKCILMITEEMLDPDRKSVV